MDPIVKIDQTNISMDDATDTEHLIRILTESKDSLTIITAAEGNLLRDLSHKTVALLCVCFILLKTITFYQVYENHEQLNNRLHKTEIDRCESKQTIAPSTKGSSCKIVKIGIGIIAVSWVGIASALVSVVIVMSQPTMYSTSSSGVRAALDEKVLGSNPNLVTLKKFEDNK
ncbi:unnamed protein product [Mytilus coruscus]|uniref:Uncharacterized protein n=1 Tax=Mytilus coruscus TaxID=42192 RepID=A0A6J8CNQ9_MYTCO|nr:unnamed protein product [Mytilus coruscus]